MRVAADDLGTGYSAMSLLTANAVDEIKLDRAFVARMTFDRAARAIVEGFVATADSLGIDVVAEGVEDGATVQALTALGVRRAQGFHLGRPAPGDTLTFETTCGAASVVLAPIPHSEPARLAALHALRVLDTDPEPIFDELVALAAEVCNTPVALISLVDEQRQWTKASHGMEVVSSCRAESYCAHVVADHACGRLTGDDPADHVLYVPDSTVDERFAGNPWTLDGVVRMYAGAPLVSRDGHAIGTLCVLDRHARLLSVRQRRVLAGLARQVVAHLESRAACSPLAS